MKPILDMLHKDTNHSTRLYVLIDSATEDLILAEILENLNGMSSLFTGAFAGDAARSVPYLVCLHEKPDIERQLLVQGWGKFWGTYFTSDADTKTLLHHFRQCFYARGLDGSTIFFRFYDPRVLRDYLPLLSPGESRCFFGPVKRFVLESDYGLPMEFVRPDVDCSMEIHTNWQILDGKKRNALNTAWERRYVTDRSDNSVTFLNRRFRAV